MVEIITYHNTYFIPKEDVEYLKHDTYNNKYYVAIKQSHKLQQMDEKEYEKLKEILKGDIDA